MAHLVGVPVPDASLAQSALPFAGADALIRPRGAIFDSSAPVQCGSCGAAPTGLFPRGAQIQCCSCGASSAVFVGHDPAGALAAALDVWCRRSPVIPSPDRKSVV